MAELGTFTSSRLVADKSVTILSGQTESDVINTLGTSLLGFVIPAAWTDCDINFKVSLDGVTFVDLFDEDDILITVNTSSGSKAYKVEPVKLAGFNVVKLVSSVAQGGDRVIGLALRSY